MTPTSVIHQTPSSNPEFGIYRGDDKIPVKNVINLRRIEEGEEAQAERYIRQPADVAFSALRRPRCQTHADAQEHSQQGNRQGSHAFYRGGELACRRDLVRSNLTLRPGSQVAGRCFDVIYVRQDWRTNLNVGCKWGLAPSSRPQRFNFRCADGFVNFVSTQALLTFARARIGTRWNLCGSDKLCVASYANIQVSTRVFQLVALGQKKLKSRLDFSQGKSNLIAHFRNSSVLDQEESRRPKLFYTDGPFAGQPEPFPGERDVHPSLQLLT